MTKSSFLITKMICLIAPNESFWTTTAYHLNPTVPLEDSSSVYKKHFRKYLLKNASVHLNIG